MIEKPEFGSHYDLPAPDGRLMMRAWFDWHERPASKGREMGRESVTLAVPPTAPDEDGARPVPPGDWRLLVEPTGEDGQSWPMNLFVHRDNSLPGYVSKGRQSRFHDNRYRVRDDLGRLQLSDELRDCHVRRSGTLSAFGYSDAAIVVGGCHRDGLARGKPARGSVADYSGQDFPPVPKVAQRPDLTAPSEESRVRHGVPAAGTRSGSKIPTWGHERRFARVARELAVQLAGERKGKSEGASSKLLGIALKPGAHADPPAFIPGGSATPRAAWS